MTEEKNVLSLNGYKFYIDFRVFEDFNQEQYKYPKDLSENLLSNDDLKETIESFLTSLNSMYNTYSVIMSKFILTCMLEKINGYY